MLACNVFVDLVDGTWMYRGTVTRDDRTLWTGPWRTSEWKAHEDANNGARIVSIRAARQDKDAQRLAGPVWPLSRDVS